MTTTTISGWRRVAMAIERIHDRLLRVTAALNAAGVPYAVIGGNAVAEWVGRVDSGAVRFTKDVDLLLRRSDLPAAVAAVAPAGFVHQRTFDVDMFLDGPDSSPKEAVHLLFAREKVTPQDPCPAPDVEESEFARDFLVLNLESLVRMKLTSYRLKDRVHLQDMLGVGLIDATWPARFTPELAARLQSILDTPGG